MRTKGTGLFRREVPPLALAAEGWWTRFIRERPEVWRHAAFVCDYDMLLCEHLVQGVDLRMEEFAMSQPLAKKDLDAMHAYWRAANYLSVGQIYLYANPLLKEPLTPAHIKPRLLGHWGTTPGLNFIYVHLNRLINQHDLDMIVICGPGHGGPAMVANTYLEGTYSELYPSISRDEEGLRRLFKQFSFPRSPLISGDDTAPAVRVVPTDEDLVVARHTRRLIEQEH